MDRYLLSQRTRKSALAIVLACCLTAFVGAVPKQEPAQDNAPLTVENFGKVNDHIYRGGQPKGDDYRRLSALGIKTILDLRGWTVLFNGIHGAPNGKIEALRKISEAEHARGEEIVVVGDGVDDAYAANFIGAQFLAVVSGSYATANPDFQVLPLHEVGSHVLALRPL